MVTILPQQLAAMVRKYPAMQPAINYIEGTLGSSGVPVFKFLYKYPNNDSVMFTVDAGYNDTKFFILTPTGVLYARTRNVKGKIRGQMKTGINSLKDAFISFIGYDIQISAVYVNGDIAIKDDEGIEYILASSGNIYQQAFIPDNSATANEPASESFSDKWRQEVDEGMKPQSRTLGINELRTHVRLRNLTNTFIWAVFIDGVLRNWGFEAEGPAFGDASIHFNNEMLDPVNNGHNIITTVYKVDSAGNINEMPNGYHSGTGMAGDEVDRWHA